MGSTNDVCVLVGYAGFYGFSLIVDSYTLLFVSMAARTPPNSPFSHSSKTLVRSHSCSRFRAPERILIYTCRFRTTIRRTQAPCRAQTRPSLRCSIPPTKLLLSNTPPPPNLIAFPRPDPSPALVFPRNRPLTPMDPMRSRWRLGQHHSWSGHPYKDG